MKYLVTGAAGFIGSHLLKSLAEEGHSVLGLDNYNDYYSPQMKRLRVATILRPLGLEVKEISLENIHDVNSLIRKFEPDKVFHFAAQPGVRLPLNEYSSYVDRNLVGFSNIIGACVANEIPDFLYASSSSVYGNFTGISSSEKENAIEPISFYGATKLAGEVLAKTIVRNSSTRARGLRLFTVYGPWGRPDMAYFRIISSYFTDYCFQMFGDGSIKRDFTNIRDITNLTQLLSIDLSSRNRGFHDVVNIGGGNSVSLVNMIETLENILGKDLLFEKYEHNPNDVIYTNADSTYLESLVGEKPKVNLEEGLTEVIEWASRLGNLHLLKDWSESVN
jgi:UDP-glucuronate 4-epimerase